MKDLTKKIEEVFTKITLAEDGVENTGQVLKEQGGFVDDWDDIFVAITFAEAGEFETARQILKKNFMNLRRYTTLQNGVRRCCFAGK